MAVTATATALVSCGSLMVQSNLLGSLSGLQQRPTQKSKGSTLLVGCSLNVEANLAEAALVTSRACSPPRTQGATRTLAPAVSIAARKSKRRRGRPSGGSGDGGKGNDGSDGRWGDGADDDDSHKRMVEGLWLWQAVCWLSLVQAVVWTVASLWRSQPFRSSLLASASVATSHERPAYPSQPLEVVA